MIVLSEYIEPDQVEGYVEPPLWKEAVCKVTGHWWDQEHEEIPLDEPVTCPYTGWVRRVRYVTHDKLYTFPDGCEVKHCRRCDHVEIVHPPDTIPPQPLHTVEMLCSALGHFWQDSAYIDFIRLPGDVKVKQCRRCHLSQITVDDR